MRPVAVPPETKGLTIAHLSFATARREWDDRTAGLVEEAFPEAAHPGLVGDPFTGSGGGCPAAMGGCAAAAWGCRVSAAGRSSVLAPLLYAGPGQHPDFARALVALFSARFDPAIPDRPEAVAHARQSLEHLTDRAATLDEDKIMRGLVSFVMAVLRTNWYCTDNGRPRPHRAFKLDPSQLTVRAPVTPFREIFVHAADVQGVHLRAGEVARGGLRWSDRPEDFRVEVLGLMKTQRVKNAVIVPDGAKGAFVVRPGADPATCYDTSSAGCSMSPTTSMAVAWCLRRTSSASTVPTRTWWSRRKGHGPVLRPRERGRAAARFLAR